MKRLLLIAAATAALSTSAMADEGQFYLRADASANKFQGFTSKGNVGVKLKTKWNAGLDVGVGYYIMDNVRGEFVFTKPFNVEAKGSTQILGANVSIKHKGDINALFVKAYVDVADLGMAKLFVGGGLGWSMIKEKISGTSGLRSWGGSTKKANALAWTVGLGAGFEVADGVKIDVQYAFTDFGKTKSRTDAVTGITYGKNGYRMHSGKVGVRFDI